MKDSERGDRERERRENREEAIPDYMCLWCSVGGHVLEQVSDLVKGIDGGKKRQRESCVSGRRNAGA